MSQAIERLVALVITACLVAAVGYCQIEEQRASQRYSDQQNDADAAARADFEANRAEEMATKDASEAPPPTPSRSAANVAQSYWGVE